MRTYPITIMAAIRQNLGLKCDDTSLDGRIMSMSRHEALNRVATWHGLLDYGAVIREWVEEIYGVSLEATK